MLAASVLALEGLTVFFAGLVAMRFSALSTGASLGLFGGLALLALVLAGLAGRPGGYVLGSGLQVLVLATGFWVPVMFFLGAVFGALWVAGLRIGARIERERAEYAARQEPAAP